MDGRRFRAWIEGLGELNAEQRRLLAEKMSEIDEPTPQDVVDSAPDKPTCPHCESSVVVRNGRQDGLQTFRCKACGKRFNRLSGTPLSRLRYRGKWRQAVESIRQKETLSQMQERLGVCRDTAHRWRHRLLGMLKPSVNPSLSGVVEADETFVRHSCKGQRKSNGRKARKRGGKSKSKGLPLEEYSCVWIARDRNRNTAHYVSMHRDALILKGFLSPLIQPGSILCTDGRQGYAKFVRQADGIQHVALNQSRGKSVRDSVYHIQNANNYHSRLKAWLASFNGVASSYLQNYLAWFRFSSGLSENLFSFNPNQFFLYANNTS